MRTNPFILSIVLSVSVLVACGGSATPTEEGAEATPAAAAATKAPIQTEAVETKSNPQIITVTCGSGEHFCRTGCGTSYCEANGVDCAVCFRVGTICECE